MFLEVKSKLFHLKWGTDMGFKPISIEQLNNTPKTLLFFNFIVDIFQRAPPPYIKKKFSMDQDESQ